MLEGILGRRGNTNIVMRENSLMCAGLAVRDMLGKQGADRETRKSQQWPAAAGFVCPAKESGG